MADGTRIEESSEPVNGRSHPVTSGSGAPGAADDASAPYPGLRSFGPGDEDRYYGRDELVDVAVKRFWRALDEPDRSAWLWVVGPSGAGKTSLLRAGLCPRLASLGYEHLYFTPGEDPMAALAAAFAAHLGIDPVTAAKGLGEDPVRWLSGQREGTADTELILVIDEFEQLFLLNPPAQRRQFLATLAALTAPGATGRCVVAAGLDISVYGWVVAEPTLVNSLQDTQVLVRPLTGDQLHQAIVEPARAAGHVVDDDLVDLLMENADAEAADGDGIEVTRLPLIAHALRETWHGATALTLTAQACRAAGGPTGAAEASAEAVWGGLDSPERKVTRRLIARMAYWVGDRAVTVPLPVTELGSLGDRAVADDVVQRFVAARLMTRDNATVAVAHPALLIAWARAEDWMGRLPEKGREAVPATILDTGATPVVVPASSSPESGDGRSAGNRSAGNRSASNRSAGNRSSGNRSGSPSGGRSSGQRSRGSTRWPWVATAVAAVVALVAVAAAVVVGLDRNDATVERDVAQARQAALASDDLRATDPALAAQLAVAGHALAETPESRSALLNATAGPPSTRYLGGSGPATTAVASDADVVAVGDAGEATVQVFAVGEVGTLERAGVIDLLSVPEVTDPAADADGGAAAGDDEAEPEAPDPADAELATLALSPDGGTLVTGDGLGQLTWWDLADPMEPELLSGPLAAFEGPVRDMAVSPDGTEMAAVGAGVGGLLRWSLEDPANPEDLPTAVTLAVPWSVAYDPERPAGEPLVVVGTEIGSIQVWNLGGPPRMVHNRTPGQESLGTLAISPDRTTMAAGSHDGELYVWDLTDGYRNATRIDIGEATFEDRAVEAVTFSPESGYLAAGAGEVARVWPITGGDPVVDLLHPAAVTGAGFVDDHTLFSAGADGTARQWEIGPGAVFPVQGPVRSLAATTDGERVAAVSASEARVWELDPELGGAPGELLARVDGSVDGVGESSGAADLSPDGDYLALGSDRADEVWIVDLTAEEGPERVGTATLGDPGDEDAENEGDGDAEGTEDVEPGVVAVAFAPDQRLAAAGRDGQVHVWELQDVEEPELLGSAADAEAEIRDLTWSPDGELLAAASADSLVHLYTADQGPELATSFAGVGENGDDPTASGDPEDQEVSDTGARAVAFDGSSGRLVVAGVAGGTGPDRTSVVTVWNLDDPTRPDLVAGPIDGPADPFVDVDAGDGYVAAAGLDGSIWLWRLEDLEEAGVDGTDEEAPEPWAVLASDGASDGVSMRAVNIAPEGGVVRAGDDRGRVTTWLLGPDVAADTVCGTVGDLVTEGEWADHLAGIEYNPAC